MRRVQLATIFSFTPSSTTRRILAFAHQDDSGHDIVLIVHADQTLARHGAGIYFGDIADQDRHAGALGDHDVADVLGRLAAGRRRGS